MVLHATILNDHLEYMKEYIERGSEVNYKDFADWTPLHCAVFMGNVLYIKELIHRPYISLQEKNDEGKTPIQLAIESGSLFGEENAVTCLLERGVEIEEDIWHKLLILALNYDIVQYVRLAHKARVELHNTNIETKISLHKAVCCHAVKIIRFFGETFS